MSARWVLVAGVVALTAAALQQWLLPFTASSQMGLLTNGGDLDIYRHGGLQVLHGGALYAAELPSGGWFTYPPFAAVTFIPLALLSFPVAKAVWMLISFGAIVATIWRCAIVLGYRPDWLLGVVSAALAVVALDVEAVRGTLWQGQINLVLMAIIVWDLTRRPGARLRGWSIGLAAGVKLTAVVFIPYLLFTRQWRAAITAVATSVATVMVTWAVLPADSLQYWTYAVFQTDRIGPLAHPGNFSIGGVVATLCDPAPMATIWWIGGIAVTALLGFYAAYRADRADRRLLAITITGLLSCALPPLAWGHHWVWTVPLLAIALDKIVRNSAPVRWAWAGATVAIFAVTFMWFSAWLYRASQRVHPSYPTYVDAFNAAIEHMTRFDRLFAVSTHPLLFLTLAIVTITVSSRTHPKPVEHQ